MNRHLLAMALSAAVALGTQLASAPAAGSFPVDPPEQRPANVSLDNTVLLDVEYDESFLHLHGANTEALVREVVALQNVEWRRYRRDWFVLNSLRVHSSGRERDASHVLASFLRRTDESSRTIHIYFVGRDLEVYPPNDAPLSIGGLAYRSADALILSATEELPPERIAYFLFHEMGHCFDTLDIPFRGGDSTYGSHRKPSFDIDAGNAEILAASSGPQPRKTPARAAAIIEEKLARAESYIPDPMLYEKLHDVLLHEPSPLNAEYIAKKQALIAAAGAERDAILALLEENERNGGSGADPASLRAVAVRYWKIDGALRDGDTATAQDEWNELRRVRQSNGDVQMLVDAIGRSVESAARSADEHDRLSEDETRRRPSRRLPREIRLRPLS